MKGSYIAYFIFVTFFVIIGTMVIGAPIGQGSNEIGYVIVALSMVCGTIVACTCAIIDTIRGSRADH